MECKDCKMFKECTNVTDEVCNDFKAADRNDGFDNITNIAPEETEETEEIEEEKELDNSAERAKNSIDKLIDTITEAVKKSSDAPKAPKTAPQKKPFKIGFWGYLTIAAVIKGTVDIARAVADAKRPRK